MLSATPTNDSWAINTWLSKRRGAAVPLRERSLEIFGDEKFLETRVSGPLFAPGRLTLALLETYLCWPPVERVNLGPGDWLLVENFTTYHSIATRAQEFGSTGRSSGAPVTASPPGWRRWQPSPRCRRGCTTSAT